MIAIRGESFAYYNTREGNQVSGCVNSDWFVLFNDTWSQ